MEKEKKKLSNKRRMQNNKKPVNLLKNPLTIVKSDKLISTHLMTQIRLIHRAQHPKALKKHLDLEQEVKTINADFIIFYGDMCYQTLNSFYSKKIRLPATLIKQYNRTKYSIGQRKEKRGKKLE